MSKAAYRRAFAAGARIPLFSQPWWLDAVVGEAGWDVAVVEQDGQLVAAMPFAVGRRLGFTVAYQPALTQSLGPWLAPTTAKYANALSREKRLLTELIGQLPEVAHFQQNWHPSRTNWLPFYWAGFEQTTRYTYVIPDLSNLDQVWAGFDQGIRTDIRKAESRFGLTVRSAEGVAELLRLNSKVFERQAKTIPYSPSMVESLFEACRQRRCGRVVIAEDDSGTPHAGALVVWDGDSAYYLMGGANPALRNSGAASLCLWESIRHAAGTSRQFDFEGSMLEPVERFFRGFGARQVAYFQVSRTSSRVWRLLDFLRDVRKGRP